ELELLLHERERLLAPAEPVERLRLQAAPRVEGGVQDVREAPPELVAGRDGVLPAALGDLQLEPPVQPVADAVRDEPRIRRDRRDPPRTGEVAALDEHRRQEAADVEV